MIIWVSTDPLMLHFFFFGWTDHHGFVQMHKRICVQWLTFWRLINNCTFELKMYMLGSTIASSNHVHLSLGQDLYLHIICLMLAYPTCWLRSKFTHIILCHMWIYDNRNEQNAQLSAVDCIVWPTMSWGWFYWIEFPAPRPCHFLTRWCFNLAVNLEISESLSELVLLPLEGFSFKWNSINCWNKQTTKSRACKYVNQWKLVKDLSEIWKVILRMNERGKDWSRRWCSEL